jgi:multimeric flavodoxin WrbA
VLEHEQIIFATPIYWYAVSPAMKVFIDRISDLLELPDLLSEGRRLRGKTAYVVCTSISDEPSEAFMEAFRETFDYLGMRFGGVAHVNCHDGYLPAAHDPEALKLAALVRGKGRAPRWRSLRGIYTLQMEDRAFPRKRPASYTQPHQSLRVGNPRPIWSD